MKTFFKWTGIIVVGFIALCILFPGDQTKPQPRLCQNAQEVKNATGGRASDKELLDMGLCDPELQKQNLEAMRASRYKTD